MSAFFAIAALLVAGTVAFVVSPLLRTTGRRAFPSRSAANLAVYRGEHAALERERSAGRVAEAQYQQERRELERRMLDDVGPPVPPQCAAPSGAAERRTAIGMALLVVLAAGLVYAAVGNLRAIDPPPAPRQAHALAGGQIGAMVDRLAMRLREAPNDAEGWTMLARSLAALGRYEESAKAFARLAELTPGNAGVLADYADTLAMARGRKLDGPPFALVKRALAIDPKHLKSLALAGSAEFERGNFQSAIRYWERILALVPAESGFAGSVQASIAQARQKLSGS